MHKRRIRNPKLLLALAILAGCSATPPAKSDTEPQTMIEQPAQLFDETTPAGQQLSWVLTHLNEPAQTVTLDELDQHFDATFKAQVPPAQMQQVFAQLAAGYGPFAVTQTKTGTPEAIVVQVKTKTDELWIISIAAKLQAPHAITGLVFQPDATANQANLPKTWEELDEQVKQGATLPVLYVAKIDEAENCQPVHALRGDEQQPLGSAFKLYILGALAQQIDAGKLSWDKELSIKDELKSLPSGVLQDKAAGEKVTVKEAASKMISISDNTATDHLLNLVGRDNVEAWVKTSGHSSPERLTPFLSTRELFQIKLGQDEAWRATYVGMSVPERRKALKKLASEPLPGLESASGWDEPRDVNTIEWFASGQDLCALHATFFKNKDRPAYKTALEIMAINDAGLGLSPNEWPYVGFKGGSEPGVMFLSFLLQDAQGDWYSISTGGSDDERPQGAGPYVGYITAVINNLLNPQ